MSDDGFADLFGRAPEGAWAAPGRVNVIGEHTDYNDGFVLPIALPHRVVAWAARRDDDRVWVASRQAMHSGRQAGAGSSESSLPDGHDTETGVSEVALAELAPGAVGGWAAYVVGVVWSLRAAGHDVGGLDVLVDGNVPLGAGLSSSAALECATALAATELYGVEVDRPTLARLAQRAENDFVGMPCGILDQSASLLCVEGHALFLDTRTLQTEQVPFDLAADDLALLVVDTRAPHRHVDGEYASRRRACHEAAEKLGVAALRDIEVDDLDDTLARLDDTVACRRVRHVVTENARVLDTITRLRESGPRAIGRLLNQSHVSLRDDYEVTVPEVDTAFEAALAAGALGARITGGGFGGCVIALIEAEAEREVAAAVEAEFCANGFDRPETFAAVPSPGGRRLQ